ncbi:histidine phosphatase family protein [Nakamurella silvestris]|nr:histidine phosphatase family protein [Nakamurella silvestris]
MSQRLFLISAGATGATRAGRFPVSDEPLERPDDMLPFRTVDHLLSGPELRCRQTAANLDTSGLVDEVDPRLADLGVGSWAGRDLPTLAVADPAGLQDWMTDPAARPHGGESLADLIARTAAFLADQPIGRIAAVTSAWVLKAALIQVLGGEPARIFDIDVGPLDVLELTGRDNRWRLRRLGPLG